MDIDLFHADLAISFITGSCMVNLPLSSTLICLFVKYSYLFLMFSSPTWNELTLAGAVVLVLVTLMSVLSMACM